MEKRKKERAATLDFHYLNELMEAGLNDGEIAYHMDTTLDIINDMRIERERNW
jgi:hypothetical protein